MINETLVNLSRLQFGITAMYHYLFVPLTIGLAIMLGIMETVYVFTDKVIWRDMTKFWGKLFAINFAMGIATGITMEFQFGTNWAYYSHYVGDIFGIPLALEGMMAFFLESSFVGLFFFGWNKMGKFQHLLATWLVAIGTNLSGVWILIANAWMQNPVGSVFNPLTMRMELKSITKVILNEVAQAKFVHTISGGYVTGAIFVLSVSSFYLLKKRNIELAKRSIVVAASFGLLSICSVIILGDESGYSITQNQKTKLATIEAMWHTEPAPAGFTLFGIPNQKEHRTDFEIKVPYMLGLIATRSTDTEMLGIKELTDLAEKRIENGIKQYQVLYRLRAGSSKTPTEDATYLKENYRDLGYALLLKRYTDHPPAASKAQIRKAAEDTIPKVIPMFFSFRIMVACGFAMLLIFITSFYYFVIKKRFDVDWFYKVCILSTPLPWIANELGWFVAEYGRQPWVIEGVLPTFLAASTQSVQNVGISLSTFVILYSALLVVDIFLMVRYIKLGPDYILAK